MGPTLKRRARAVLLGAIGLGLGVIALGTTVGWFLSEPGHRGPVTDHFDGTEFVNTIPTHRGDLRSGLEMLRNWRRGPWEEWTEVPPQPDPPERVDDLRVTFINHATVLVQTAGINLLLDPIWSDRCSAVQFAGPKRHHPPGLRFDQLPPIDAVLISHNHYDHLDLGTLEQLESHGPVLITGLGNGDILERNGHDRVVELDWNDTTTVGPLTIVGQEVRHFSSRGMFDRNKTLWLGFVIDGPAGPIYFAGDTGDGPHFRETAAAHGPFRLAILPIGAYLPRWVMAPVHIDPGAAVQAHLDLGAHRSLAVHFGTFRLSNEGQQDPPVDLAAAAHAAGLGPDDFWALQPGEGRDVPRLPSTDPAGEETATAPTATPSQ